MERIFGTTRVTTVQGDITRQAVDAVVNAANSTLLGGGGVDGAIHRAGGPAILEECKAIVRDLGRLTPGKAVITTGGNLPARHVIHTVGPVWQGGGRDEAATLRSAYRESLQLAEQRKLRSVAFPSISTGAYGYPVAEAVRVAVSAVVDHLRGGSGLDEVRFTLFSAGDLACYGSALQQVDG